MAPSRPHEKNRDPGRNPARLLEDSEVQLAVGNVDGGIALAKKALEATGQGGDFELRALNLLGVLHMEAGDVDEACRYFRRAVGLDEDGTSDEMIGGGPEKFLFLAQLSDEGGQDSVQWFEKGASALRKQIQSLNNAAQKSPEQLQSLEEKQNKLGEVLCAVAEVYMTDLSWEEDAEKRCEVLITEAMMIAPGSAETWQTVANVRISQERLDEAKAALKRSLELWQHLPLEHPAVPAFPTRIGLIRLLLEVGMEDEAFQVVERLVSEDDSSVEAWYLGGWCLYLAGEKICGALKQPSPDGGEEWKEAWGSSRRWLSTCLKLYEVQEYEDERLGEHAVELLQAISRELGDPPEEEDDEWEDASDEEEGDEDEDMGE